MGHFRVAGEMAIDRVVIIGAGQAAGDLAAALRERSFPGQVTLVGDEVLHPYSRPPLSKTYLLEEKQRSDLLIRSEDTYIRYGIDVHLGTRVRGIDRSRAEIHLAEGGTIGYDALVIATGGVAAPYPGGKLDGVGNVHYLRTFDDVERFRGRLAAGTRLTIIGGGFIGLEVAATAESKGVKVTVVERQDRLLSRVASPPISSFFGDLHSRHGVDVRTGRLVSDFKMTAAGDVSAVILDDGTAIDTDLCLIAIGLAPNSELAEDCGLDVADGIVVDEYLRTTDPAIFAIGDVARHPCSERGGTRRVESVANATEQARTLAATLCGQPASYSAVPWFWSDQYGLKYQSVGVRDPDDCVVLRGGPNVDGPFAVFYLRDGAVRAADVVQSPADFAMARKLVATRATVDPSLLADPSVPLRRLVGPSRR